MFDFDYSKFLTLFGGSEGAQIPPEAEEDPEVDNPTGGKGDGKVSKSFSADILAKTISGSLAGKKTLQNAGLSASNVTEESVKGETKALFGWSEYDDSLEAQVVDKLDDKVKETVQDAENLMHLARLNNGANSNIGASAIGVIRNCRTKLLDNGNTQTQVEGRDYKGDQFTCLLVKNQDDKIVFDYSHYISGDGQHRNFANVYNDLGQLQQRYTQEGNYCSLDGYLYNADGEQIGCVTEVYTKATDTDVPEEDNSVSGKSIISRMAGFAGASIEGLDLFNNAGNDVKFELFATRKSSETRAIEGEKLFVKREAEVFDAMNRRLQEKTTTTEYNNTSGNIVSTTQEVKNYNEEGNLYQERQVVSQYREADQKLKSQTITVRVPVEENGQTRNIESSATIAYNYRDDGTLESQVTSGTDMSGRQIDQTLTFSSEGRTVVSARISYDDGAVVENYEGDNVLSRVRGSLPDTTEIYEDGQLQYRVENRFNSDGILVRIDVKDDKGEAVAYYDLTRSGEGLVIVSPKGNSQVVTFINAIKGVEGGEEYVRSLVHESVNEAGQIVYSVDIPGAQTLLEAIKQKIINEFGADHPEIVGVIDKLLTATVIQNAIRQYGLENILREYNAGDLSSVSSVNVTVPTNLKPEILAQAGIVSAAMAGDIPPGTVVPTVTMELQMTSDPESVATGENAGMQLLQSDGMISMADTPEDSFVAQNMGLQITQNPEMTGDSHMVSYVMQNSGASDATDNPESVANPELVDGQTSANNSEVVGVAGNAETSVVQNNGMVNFAGNMVAEGEAEVTFRDIFGVDNIRYITQDIRQVLTRYDITQDELIQIMQKAGIDCTVGSIDIVLIEKAYEDYIGEIRMLTGVPESSESIAGIDLPTAQSVAEAGIQSAVDISFAMMGTPSKRYMISGGRNTQRVLIENGHVRLVGEMNPEEKTSDITQQSVMLANNNANNNNRLVRTAARTPVSGPGRVTRVPGKYVTSTGEILDYDELIARIMNNEMSDAIIVNMNVVQHSVGTQNIEEGEYSFNVVGVTEDNQVILADNITARSFVPGDENNLTIQVKDMEKAASWIILAPISRINNIDVDPENNTNSIYNGGARVASASGGTGSGDGGGGGGNGQQDAPAPTAKNRIDAEVPDLPSPSPNIFPQ
ncbi:hypothetical protein J6S88_05340 [bacterium]|nr:hypothetical protein [bacterium]